MRGVLNILANPRDEAGFNVSARPREAQGTKLKYRVIVPTLNAAAGWRDFSKGLLACVTPDLVTIIDSDSSDGTVELAEADGFDVISIRTNEFNHGGTRQMGADLYPNADLFVYLTQDAILADRDAIRMLLTAFADSQIGAAYGRQLPRKTAAPIEAHARIFNYPPVSHTRNFDSRCTLGVKAAFFSNSFAAYRRSALLDVGGFPSDVILGEDMVTAGRMLVAGWKVGYVAEACVYHSHDFTWRQEFKRYFDIGVLHCQQAWLQETFGKASDEGLRYLKSEMLYLSKHQASLIPTAILRTALKLGGYKLGRMERAIAPWLKRKLSLHWRYWVAPRETAHSTPIEPRRHAAIGGHERSRALKGRSAQ